MIKLFAILVIANVAYGQHIKPLFDTYDNYCLCIGCPIEYAIGIVHSNNSLCTQYSIRNLPVTLMETSGQLTYHKTYDDYGMNLSKVAAIIVYLNMEIAANENFGLKTSTNFWIPLLDDPTKQVSNEFFMDPSIDDNLGCLYADDTDMTIYGNCVDSSITAYAPRTDCYFNVYTQSGILTSAVNTCSPDTTTTTTAQPTPSTTITTTAQPTTSNATTVAATTSTTAAPNSTTTARATSVASSVPTSEQSTINVTQSTEPLTTSEVSESTIQPSTTTSANSAVSKCIFGRTFVFVTILSIIILI